MYGQNATFQPRDGRWNMMNKRLYKPAEISGCAVIIYDRRFGPAQEARLKVGLFNVTQMLGIQGMPPDPPVLRKDATGSAYWNVSESRRFNISAHCSLDDVGRPIILQHIREVGMLHKLVKGNLPNLILVVLPDLAEDIYIRIKKYVFKKGTLRSAVLMSTLAPEISR